MIQQRQHSRFYRLYRFGRKKGMWNSTLAVHSIIIQGFTYLSTFFGGDFIDLFLLLLNDISESAFIGMNSLCVKSCGIVSSSSHTLCSPQQSFVGGEYSNCKVKIEISILCVVKLAEPRLQTTVRQLGLESSMQHTQGWLILIIFVQSIYLGEISVIGHQ